MLLRGVVCTAADRGRRRPGLKPEGSFLVRLPTHVADQEESVAGDALSRTIAAALGGRQARKVIVSRPNAQLHAILAESVDIVPGDVICHSMLFFFAVACRSSQVPFGPMFSIFSSPRDTRSYPWVCHPQEPVAMQQTFVAYVEPRKFTGLSPDQGASQCQTNSKEEGSALLATLQ